MKLFQELLDAADFRDKLAELYGDFRSKHGLPEIHQLGLVVRDVESAAKELESLAIGPFFIASGPANWLEDGKERTFHGKVGLAYYHGVELELLGPGQGTDFYLNSLDKDGRIVVQHVGFEVDDVDKWTGQFEARGFSRLVRGKVEMGPLGVDFAYLDTSGEAGVFTEFLSQWRFGTFKFSLPRSLVQLAGSFQKLTGIRGL